MKKNVTKGQRQRLKLQKDTKVSTCQVVYCKSDQRTSDDEGVGLLERGGDRPFRSTISSQWSVAIADCFGCSGGRVTL